MADVGLNFWLNQWSWEPSIFIGTALITGLYLYAVGPLRRRHHPTEQIKRSQVIYFLPLARASPLQCNAGESEHSYPGTSHLHCLWRDNLVAHLQPLARGITTPLPGRPGTLSLL